jgi:hypothetical protein
MEQRARSSLQLQLALKAGGVLVAPCSCSPSDFPAHLDQFLGAKLTPVVRKGPDASDYTFGFEDEAATAVIIVVRFSLADGPTNAVPGSERISRRFAPPLS